MEILSRPLSAQPSKFTNLINVLYSCRERPQRHRRLCKIRDRRHRDARPHLPDSEGVAFYWIQARHDNFANPITCKIAEEYEIE